MLAASVNTPCRSAARTALSRAAPFAYASTALERQLAAAAEGRARPGERVASRIMPRRTRAPRTTHNQARLNPLVEVDELLGVGLGAVEEAFAKMQRGEVLRSVVLL